MKEAVPGLLKKRINYTGGLDEISPVADISLDDAMEMENFRLSKDGKRIEKRKAVSTIYSLGLPIYGHTTYYDSDGVYCQLYVLSTSIRRRVGAAYETVHTFPTFTFVDGDVTVASNTITEASHPYSQTGAPAVLTTTGTLPAGLALATTYYVVRVDANTIKLATSRVNADKGTAVDITAAAGGGTHTITSTISHPVNIISAQGKHFIISEIDSRMIHTDKADYQIGIDAPDPATALSYAASGSSGGLSAGDYGYAITYARSGNYGCEGNPHMEFVPSSGAYTQGGASAHNDLTFGGTYTGTTDFASFQVHIDGVGTPNTFKYTFDGGTTWPGQKISLASTNYIANGIELYWGATTGHEAGDLWILAMKAYVVTATAGQSVALTNIPVSGDAQVDQRKIYRTLANGARYYWMATINDNTSTVYTDGHPDSYLGPRLSEDNDVLPNGKFSIWFDDRLWVLDAKNNIAYYSRADYPEEFDLDVRFITFRQQFSDDECTGWIVYKDALWVFKRRCMYVVIKQANGYGRYQYSGDIGCIAPWTIVEVNGKLMWLSHRGWEEFDGMNIPTRLSIPIDRTIKTATPATYDKFTSVHHADYSEVWLAISQASGSCIMVYNYMARKFYKFTFHAGYEDAYHTTWMGVVRDSTKALVLRMGNLVGNLMLGESGYKDLNATLITAKIKKPWLESAKYANYRYMETEFECPADMTLTLNVYVNFELAAARTHALLGSTPSATNIELRRPIRYVTELGQRGKYFCIEYTNAQNLGGELKINKTYLYHADTVFKGNISGD